MHGEAVLEPPLRKAAAEGCERLPGRVCDPHVSLIEDAGNVDDTPGHLLKSAMQKMLSEWQEHLQSLQGQLSDQQDRYMTLIRKSPSGRATPNPSGRPPSRLEPDAAARPPSRFEPADEGRRPSSFGREGEGLVDQQKRWIFPDNISRHSVSEAWAGAPHRTIVRSETQISTTELPPVKFSQHSDSFGSDTLHPPLPQHSAPIVTVSSPDLGQSISPSHATPNSHATPTTAQDLLELPSSTPKRFVTAARASILELKTLGTGVSSLLDTLELVRRRNRLEEIREQRMSRTGLRWFIRSQPFRTVCSAVILMNAICIGLQVDHSMDLLDRSKQQDDMSSFWRWVEFSFCVFFTIELLIRIVAERVAFLIGVDWKWNAFDSWLVVSSIVSLTVEFATEEGPSFAFARMLRLFRFMRVLRILRAMRFSHSLRLMLYSILSTGMSLFWVFFLLLFVIYFFTIFFLNSIVDHFENAYDPARYNMVKEYYSSVEGTVLSLFMCITGGVDWREVVLPLEDLSGWYTAAFVLYVFFMVFGVLNVVVAAFVDAAYQVSQNDREAVTRAQLKQEREYISRLKTIFHEADQDNDGTLSWQEFESYLKDPTVAAFFHSLDLDVTIAKELFALLDTDNTNSVGIDEFVGGCARLKGAARSIDVNMLLYENRSMISKLGDSLDALCTRISSLERTVSGGKFAW